MIDCKCDTLKVVSDSMFENEDKFLCDFDYLKEKFCKNKKIEFLASCDGLFYKNRRIYFIEFKDLKKVVDKNLSHKNIKKSLGKFIKKNFENSNLLKKIDESKHIFDDYLYKSQQRKLKFELDYFYYIVISFPNILPSENIYLKLKMLSSKKTMINIDSIREKLKTEINSLNDKIYFLKECKYFEKEEFLKRELFWKSKECKGE